MKEVKRCLIGVNIYASNDGKLTLIGKEEVEAGSKTLIYMPPLNIFSKDTELCIDLDFIEERIYEKKGGMLVRKEN
ncbi:MAG TPA: hypothetical protein PLV82_03625 [bacterium]|nr:hypothetical protein [bacterium]